MSKNSLFEQDDVVIQWDLDQTAPGKEQDPTSKLKRDSELASLIYEINSPEGPANIMDKLSGHQILTITTELPSNSKMRRGKLQSLAVINNETKEVIVITAGTRVGTGLSDLLADTRDDLQLVIGLYPEKMLASRKLNNAILEQLGDEAKDYTFHYTGHSLGAAMSDVAATDMGVKLHEKGLLTKDRISTVTFDNPGAYTLVKNRLKEFAQKKKDKEIKRHKSALKKLHTKDDIQKEKEKHKAKLEKIKQDQLELNKKWHKKVQYKAFNNRPNIINTADKQAGEKFIIVPNNQQKRSSFSNFVSWIAKKFPGPIMKKILYLISYGAITEQINEHKIDNFINVLKKEEGTLLYVKKGSKHPISLDDAAYNIKPQEYNAELFVKLKKKISKRAKESKAPQPDYSMTFEDPSTGITTRIEFTKDELSRAHRTPTKTIQTEEIKPSAKKTSPLKRMAKNLLNTLSAHLHQNHTDKPIKPGKNNQKATPILQVNKI